METYETPKIFGISSLKFIVIMAEGARPTTNDDCCSSAFQ